MWLCHGPGLGTGSKIAVVSTFGDLRVVGVYGNFSEPA